MKLNPWFLFSIVILSFMSGCTYLIFGGINAVVQQETATVSKDSILLLNLDGVIIDGEKFLNELRTYAPKENVKGIVIRVNSPGGVVGPSQEIYSEIMRVRDELNKPIYISANGLMASGAFYAAMGASKIYANSGSLLGSIGVIMNFADLSDLYQWAKVKRFNLSTGRFKDSGADFRAMRADEKDYLEQLLKESLEQFIADIARGRKMDISKVRPVADGRVFTGTSAKAMGFIDEIGSLANTLDAIGELTGLGKNPNIFKPRKSTEDFFEMLSNAMVSQSPFSKIEEKMGLKTIGKPMFVLPQYISH